MKCLVRSLAAALFVPLFLVLTAQAQTNQPPVAEDDYYSVHGAATLGSLLANDSDPDGTVLNASTISTPSHGTLSGASPGYYLYTPQTGYTGFDFFSYQVCDAQNACATAMVHITVTNARPFGVEDRYVVRGYTILGHLLANDFDPDNDPLTLGDIQTEQIAVFPAHGTLYGVTGPDVKAYMPSYGYAGTDYFAYNVCDPYGGCTQVGVTLYVFENGGQRGGAENAGEAPCGGSVGEPVNVASGNMYLQQADYRAASFLSLTRTYNSAITRAGLFGRGWSSPFDESITTYDGTLFRLNLGDGRGVYFAGQGGVFTPVQTDFRATLVQNGDGTFTLTLKGGEIHRFSAAGKLLSVTDRNNNQIVLTYDGNNNLAAVTDPYGRVLTVTTDPTYGYVTSVSDSAGTAASYFYGPSLELTRVEYPDGSLFRFAYAYAAQGLVIREVKDALNNVLEAHEYDGYGRAITSEKQGGVEKVTLDYVSNTETDVTDALGRVTKYFLDKSRGRFVVTGVEGACGCGGVGSVSQSWVYDENLRVKSHTNGLGQTSVYSYDSQGNLVSAADAVGQSTFTYDGFGQTLTAADPAGGVTTYTYDAAGNLLTAKNALDKTTSFTYDGRGRLLTVTDARGKVTSFAYDTSGNLTGRTDAANGITTYAYDARGKVTAVTNALNQTVGLEYDAVGRLKKVTAPDGTFVTLTYDAAGRRTAFTDAKGHSTAFAYDGAYRLTSVTNAANKTTTYGYDLMSNPVSATDPLGRTTDFEYDGYNRLVKTVLPPAAAGATRLEERVEYDAGGRVTKTIDRAGRATSYEYDSANRLIKATDPALKATQYQYDALSRVTAVVDALNQTTTLTRDALGQVTQVSRGGKSKSFVYDAVGNRTQRTDFNGAVTTYSYDDLNRLTISYPNSTQVSYTYDALSRLLTATNAEGTVSFTYDSLGRVGSTTDVYGYITGYGYDAAGNRTQLGVGTQPNVAPAQPTATYQYDALDRLTGIADAAGLQTSYGYDDAGRRTSRGLPNGVVTTYSYDGLDRLTGLTDARLQTTLASRQYSYDAAGNITQKTDAAGAHAFGYDALDRLTSATHPSASAESYGYDAVGNRTSSHRASGYSLQPVNRLAATGAAGFSYDDNGSTLSKTEGAGTTNFTWDYEGRLTQAAPPSGASAAYKYDALGRRVERRLSTGEWERFAYDGAEVVRDRASDGTAVEYLNGPGADEKLRQADASGAYYFLTDNVGSTTALTDPLGAVVEQLGYDSFGDGAGSAHTRYAYTGRERDAATGLYYYRARWYDPKEGRFLSEDPAGFAAGVNFYAYVEGNPLTRRDPTGLDWISEDWITQALGPVAQVSAGFGDIVSGGFTIHTREWMNTNHVIIPCSGWYKAGEWMGTAHEVLSLGAGALEIAGHVAARRAAGRLIREAGEELAERELPVLQKLCFEAGTLVHTAEGLRPIEEIRQGNRVLSRNEQTGANEYKTVAQVFSREAGVLLEVAVAGEGTKPLGVTPQHPFYVLRARRDLSGEGNSAGEWAAAGDLKVGDRVLRPSGEWAEVVGIKRREGRVKVYNFEVADNHNYYVGRSGALVHNDCPETLHRLGLDKESAGRLGRKAAEAEEAIGIHGVSATAGQPRGPASSALREAIEEHFPVHNTPTRSDPLHKTIELPKPVTKEVADLFNAIFGRR